MSQISITAATPVTEPQTSTAGSSPQVNRSLNHAVANAVRQLNEAGYAGQGREVTFSVDRATKTPVIKVIDTSTKEVISQWPSEYLLEIADQNSTRK
jgi:flagellar protein FlaG